MKQLLIALDQLANTLVWLKGDGWGCADETLSARAWRLRTKSRGAATAVRVLDALFFVDPNHCESSYRAELLRQHLPQAYRSRDA